MSKPEIQKVPSTEERKLPIFQEIDHLADKIRVRAYNLFKRRGFAAGHDIDDWLTAEREVCWPTAEMIEDDGGFRISVALAGFDDKDVSVTATPREIIVKASREDQKKGTSKKDKSKVRWSELHVSDVYRRVHLPTDIDVDRIAAEMTHGMLSIEAPKAAEPKSVKKKAKVDVAD